MKKFIVGLVISIIGLYVAFRQIDLTELGGALAQAQWSLILVALLLMVFSVWVRALRWQILLLPISRVSVSTAFSSTMIGYFGNSVLPLRLGEFMRAYAIREKEPSLTAASAFGTIVVERLLDMTGTLILVILFFSLYDVPRWLASGGIALGIIVLGGFAVLLWISSTHEEWLERIENMALLQRGLGLKVRHLLHSFLHGLVSLRQTKHYWSLAFYSISLWVIYFSISWLTAHALDINITWIEVGVVLVATTMVIMIPSAPGFIGTYHAGAVLVMVGLFGQGESMSQAFAILNHAIGFVPLVAVGSFCLIRSSVTLKEVKPIEIEA
ncbi:MAG: lysylphosphatidylglycerol synthase transmembrane domain-containing protein [Candidatus Marinimicrobia bacterium]|jgi:hypothetical protein|nr:hypothetical protein [Candidatus Neomarinimicrobiota bacterium]MDP6456083.1 lysylphosphatidylglycerol synthase transmembrane domain-containing protein [Candidatus Neomarinimicrobiota bacterium]MDP6592867.1 lysylphosphatidylglycerol synthase transmembrane domain-containing protein [Candidatus Neomarinimicrobiota bacterium]MDP6836140.1 lysylphosphatidylglycerol synthase transmembrane domain-containing protein [Candidatus Neomarinimicrobiota bacterium]MDP6965872.1 lysylphosphatidylglycerol synt|tara:strand:- start:4103 stop:5080 length:978 start_codon:yes stop_codon:yes gene_type:complete